MLDLCDELRGASGNRQTRAEWLRGVPSPARARGWKLPVDGYGPDLDLVAPLVKAA